MYLSKPGLWQLETEIGFNQQKGMQTLFLVLDNGTTIKGDILVLFAMLKSPKSAVRKGAPLPDRKKRLINSLADGSITSVTEVH